MTVLYIPETIHVGYYKKKGTLDGKLGQLTYSDENGVKRNEATWNNFRNQEIPADEFENKPVSGIILNKKEEGHVTKWEDHDNSIRVYDPRGFEYVISLGNLLYILANTNSNVEEGLEGEFVYAWYGKFAVLLPTSSPEYAKFKAHSDLINSGERVSARDMVEGHVYIDRNADRFVYLGRSHAYTYGLHTGDATKTTERHYWYLQFGKDEKVLEEDITKLKEVYEKRKTNGTPSYVSPSERIGQVVHYSRITDKFIKQDGEDNLALEYGKLLLTDDTRYVYEDEIVRKPITIEDINFFNKGLYLQGIGYLEEEHTTIPIGLTELQTVLNENNLIISDVTTETDRLELKKTEEEGYVLELPQRPMYYSNERKHYESNDDVVERIYIELENVVSLEEWREVDPLDVDFTELTFLLEEDSITWVQASKWDTGLRTITDIEGNLLPVDSFEEGKHYIGIIEITVADILDLMEIEEVYRGDTLFYKSIVRKENNEQED